MVLARRPGVASSYPGLDFPAQSIRLLRRAKSRPLRLFPFPTLTAPEVSFQLA